jgi:hypothetical protein
VDKLYFQSHEFLPKHLVVLLFGVDSPHFIFF